ncbi:hypothetical protein FRB99_007333 [Tulasnella sp. 403]|nr:hypothetical protein FRB99_007333 [Tulasnella sp. 403]
MTAGCGVECLKLSYNGTRVAIACQDRVELHSTDSGKRLLELHLPNEYGKPTCLKYSRSGKYFVVGTSVGYVIVWDIEAGQVSPFSFGPYGWVNDVDISWDDTRVASAPLDGSIRLTYLQDIEDGSRVLPHTEATLVAFSPMVDVLAVDLAFGGLQIFNVATGEILAILGGNVFATQSLSFSFDGRWLWEGGEEGIRTWDTRSLTQPTQEPAFYDNPVSTISMPPNSNAAVAFVDRNLGLYVRLNCFGDSPTSHKIGTLPTHPLHESEIDIEISADGSGVVATSLLFTEAVQIYRFAFYDSPGMYRIDFTDIQGDEPPHKSLGGT